MELVLETIVNCVVASAFFVLIAVGLTLVFGTMKIANLAHGEFYMIGAYVVWRLYAVAHWPFLAAVVVATLLVGVLGVIIERGIFRPVRGNVLSGFIISIALVDILQVLVGQIWGVGNPKPVPPAIPGVLEVSGVSLGWHRFIVIPAAILLFGVLWVFLDRFRLGRGLRASTQDSEAASLQGISIDRSAAIAMFIGCGMAGAAGALMAPVMSVNPYMGSPVIIMALVVIVVGGTGDIRGAILASLLFGFLYTIVTTVSDATIANIISVLFMLFILAIRPRGLLGHAEA
jgi:branched-chain amino acid transport system permease protein